VHFANGNSVSPQVESNFNCLQSSGNFCPPQTPTTTQLNQELNEVTSLLNAVESQAQNLSAAQQQQVQPWITELQTEQQTLQQELNSQNTQ
jgi:hypothetical protein